MQTLGRRGAYGSKLLLQLRSELRSDPVTALLLGKLNDSQRCLVGNLLCQNRGFQGHKHCSIIACGTQQVKSCRVIDGLTALLEKKKKPFCAGSAFRVYLANSSSLCDCKRAPKALEIEQANQLLTYQALAPLGACQVLG